MNAPYPSAKCSLTGKYRTSPRQTHQAGRFPYRLSCARFSKNGRARQQHEHSWVFASAKTGSPYSDATILNNYLKPAAVKLGIQGLGWHTLRHSYKSWMAAAKISPAQMKDLMRHSDIETTMNVYGKTLTPEMRAANTLVAAQLL